MAIAADTYSDLDFRLRKKSNGDFNKVFNEFAINQSLNSLFKTIPGERSNNLKYGSKLPFLVYEPFDVSTAQSITEEIRDSIRIWEFRRIKIEELNVDMDFDTQTYHISLDYNIISTADIGTFEIALQKS